jgi:hypothetical protein
VGNTDCLAIGRCLPYKVKFAKTAAEIVNVILSLQFYCEFGARAAADRLIIAETTRGEQRTKIPSQPGGIKCIARIVYDAI